MTKKENNKANIRLLIERVFLRGILRDATLVAPQDERDSYQQVKKTLFTHSFIKINFQDSLILRRNEVSSRRVLREKDFQLSGRYAG